MIISEITKGIPHIEDLPVIEFLKVLENLNEYELTEKLDGSQILFGIDEYGFYTSRETKGGRRIYNEADYGSGFSSTYMRSAHTLLEHFLPDLKSAGFRPGDQVEAEVLYGAVPNVVPYSADRNYLIFLRTTEGAVNIDQLREKLQGQSLNVTLVSPFTADGKTISLHEEINTWEFSRAPIISVNLKNLQNEITENKAAILRFLKKSSSIKNLTNLTILETALNKRPPWCNPQDWKAVKEEVKDQRTYIQQVLNEKLIPPVKEVLLNHIIRPLHSSFGPTLDDGGWVEGIVFRHKATGKMIKLVDKGKFGIIREEVWKVRNTLIEHAKSINGTHSFLGNMYVNMASALGYPELGTIQAKTYLRKIGVTNEERIERIADGINIDTVKPYWISLLEQKETDLKIQLDNYENDTKNVPSRYGQQLFESTKRRTRETFAEIFQSLIRLKNETIHAQVSEDLIYILVGKQLSELT